MTYRIEIEPAALRELGDLPADVRRRITAAVDALADNPRPPTTQTLAGNLKGLRKLRVGPYRAVYDVNDDAHVVTIRGIGHRRSLYTRMARRGR